MNILGKRSLKEIVGVHPLLSACAYLTIVNLEIEDATIFDGLRTEREQRHYVAIGRSKTMYSNHLSGNSVDIVPFIDGSPRWDSKDPVIQERITATYKAIAKGMHYYANILGITLENLGEVALWDYPHYNLVSVNGKPPTYDYRKL